MDAREREQVNTQLQSLERELKAKGATVQESAARRAQYFAQRQLWSDAWREAFSVDNPVAYHWHDYSDNSDSLLYAIA
jgi:Skp family chaperone for outer membrane proteins